MVRTRVLFGMGLLLMVVSTAQAQSNAGSDDCDRIRTPKPSAKLDQYCAKNEYTNECYNRWRKANAQIDALNKEIGACNQKLGAGKQKPVPPVARPAPSSKSSGVPDFKTKLEEAKRKAATPANPDRASEDMAKAARAGTATYNQNYTTYQQELAEERRKLDADLAADAARRAAVAQKLRQDSKPVRRHVPASEAEVDAAIKACDLGYPSADFNNCVARRLGQEESRR